MVVFTMKWNPFIIQTYQSIRVLTLQIQQLLIPQYNRYPKGVQKGSESHRRLENVKFGHINSRSLYPKKDEIEFIITKNDFDVLCISETWLSEHVKDNDISIPGYNIFRKDRKHSLGGGVLYICQGKFHCQNTRGLDV